MTDLETLTSMFDRVRIVYETRTNRIDERPAAAVLTVYTSDSEPAQDGYSGFFTEYHFDELGALLKVGIWE